MSTLTVESTAATGRFNEIYRSIAQRQAWGLEGRWTGYHPTQRFPSPSESNALRRGTKAKYPVGPLAPWLPVQIRLLRSPDWSRFRGHLRNPLPHEAATRWSNHRGPSRPLPAVITRDRVATGQFQSDHHGVTSRPRSLGDQYPRYVAATLPPSSPHAPGCLSECTVDQPKPHGARNRPGCTRISIPRGNAPEGSAP